MKYFLISALLFGAFLASANKQDSDLIKGLNKGQNFAQSIASNWFTASPDLAPSSKEQNSHDASISIELEHILNQSWSGEALTKDLQSQQSSATELKLIYEPLSNMSFFTVFALNYEKVWGIEITDVYLDLFTEKHTLSLGYVEYPFTNFLDDGYDLFAKDTFVSQIVAPSGDRTLGITLKSQLLKNIYSYVNINNKTIDVGTFDGSDGSDVQTSDVQTSDVQKETEDSQWTWSASLAYEKDEDVLFGSYFYQKSLGKYTRQALGVGGYGSRMVDSFKLGLKGEAWAIKNLDAETSFTYYILPSIKWNRFALSLLVGQNYTRFFGTSAQPEGATLDDSKSLIQLSKNLETAAWEYNLKADFYFNEHLVLSLQKIQEMNSKQEDSIWSVSILSLFEF